MLMENSARISFSMSQQRMQRDESFTLLTLTIWDAEGTRTCSPLPPLKDKQQTRKCKCDPTKWLPDVTVWSRLQLPRRLHYHQFHLATTHWRAFSFRTTSKWGYTEVCWQDEFSYAMDDFGRVPGLLTEVIAEMSPGWASGRVGTRPDILVIPKWSCVDKSISSEVCCVRRLSAW